MKITLFFFSFFFASFSLAQTVSYSSGRTRVDYTDEKLPDMERTTFVVNRITSGGHVFENYLCHAETCVHYDLKLARGKDMKWTLSASRDKGTKWLTNPAVVNGDEMKLSGFSSSGKDDGGTQYKMNVSFTENGSQWKTTFTDPSGKTISTVTLFLSKIDEVAFKAGIKNKKINQR